MFEGCQGLSREFSERDGVVAMPGPVGWHRGIQLQQWTAVVMGPCVRRDDELGKSLTPCVREVGDRHLCDRDRDRDRDRERERGTIHTGRPCARRDP